VTDVVASNSAEPLLLVGDTSVSSGNSEMNKSHGFSRRCPAGPGNAGDCHRKIDIGVLERAERHRDCDFLADSAKRFELRGLDAKHLVLGFVRVCDETAVDDVRRAGNFSQGRSNETAGA